VREVRGESPDGETNSILSPPVNYLTEPTPDLVAKRIAKLNLVDFAFLVAYLGSAITLTPLKLLLSQPYADPQVFPRALHPCSFC
jgi:hypothetical protein